MRRAPRGFTLIEMLIALVLLAIVAEVLLRLLTASQRVSRAQSRQVALQSSVRAGALLVPSELRELSVGGSNPDLLVLGRDSITYRAMRGLGYTCSLIPGTADVVVNDKPSDSRRWNAAPFAADAPTTMKACADEAESDPRIIAPAFVHAFTFWIDATRATMLPSPLSEPYA